MIRTYADVLVTPIETLRFTTRDARTDVRVKLEEFGRTGSSKDRTAASLVAAMHAQRPLQPDDVLVESTSGNLGLALASAVAPHGCRLVVVLDPNAAPSTVRDLAAAGAEVVVVDERDESGGYLLTRLRTVERLCAEHPDYRWVNQYESPANPLAHETSTGPEILAQGGSELDAIYVAVSTGGTLAGISRHVRPRAPHVRLVAVDAQGSLATGGAPGRRLLPGIGAGRPSSFLRPGDYDAVRRVADVDAVAMCRHLRASTGLMVGGSSGSVLAALRGDLGAVRAPVALFADGGRRYADTLYDDGWLAGHGLLEQVRARQHELADAIRIELRSEHR